METVSVFGDWRLSLGRPIFESQGERVMVREIVHEIIVHGISKDPDLATLTLSTLNTFDSDSLLWGLRFLYGTVLTRQEQTLIVRCFRRCLAIANMTARSQVSVRENIEGARDGFMRDHDNMSAGYYFDSLRLMASDAGKALIDTEIRGLVVALSMIRAR